MKHQNRLVSGLLSICAIALLPGCGSTERQRVPLVLQSNPNASTIYPKEKFDKNAAVAALQKGNSTIQGKACVYNNANRWIYWGPYPVWLYPVTPYFEAWYTLRESSPFSTAYMDPEAIKVRLETIANKDGEYAFHNLRPGKYFLQTYMTWDMVSTESVYDGYDVVGMTPQGPVIQDNYHNETYNWKKRSTAEVFVTVARDGDKVYMDVTNRPPGLFRADNKGCE